MSVETQGRKRPPLRVACINHVFYVYHGLDVIATYYTLEEAGFHKTMGFPPPPR